MKYEMRNKKGSKMTKVCFKKVSVVLVSVCAVSLSLCMEREVQDTQEKIANMVQFCTLRQGKFKLLDPHPVKQYLAAYLLQRGLEVGIEERKKVLHRQNPDLGLWGGLSSMSRELTKSHSPRHKALIDYNVFWHGLDTDIDNMYSWLEQSYAITGKLKPTFTDDVKVSIGMYMANWLNKDYALAERHKQKAVTLFNKGSE